jgi:hypothetical protein
MTGPDCVLFMWAFAPMLLDAVQLMQARPGRKHGATRLTISRRQHEFPSPAFPQVDAPGRTWTGHPPILRRT